jgi:hypothetical protein
VQILSSGNGSAEFYVDAVSVNVGGTWQMLYNATASAGRSMESRTPGAQMTFQFTGTGFEIGTQIDLLGGEAKVCYGLSAGFPGNQKCFTYESENKTVSALVSRPVLGLPSGTYTVTVTELENGKITTTIDPNAPRLAANDPARIRIDYVRIYNDTPPTILPAGYYNQDAKDNSGNLFLRLFPTNRWGTISGTAAAAYSNKNYVTVVGTTGVAATTYAGPSALLRLNVPSADGVTVIVYTGPLASTNVSQLLACTDNVTGAVSWGGTAFSLTGTTDCTLVTSLPTSAQVVLTPALLPGLSIPGAHTLTLRGLTPGGLKIDGFQTIEGSTLPPGIYDSFTPDNLLDATPNVNPAITCNPNVEWCTFKVATAYGGTVIRTRKPNGGGLNDAPKLTFEFVGTGFSVVTPVSTTGVDMRICYKLASSSTPFPPDGTSLTAYPGNATNPPPGSVPDPNVDTNPADYPDVFCEVVTTNTTAATWTARNTGRLNPVSGQQYGFAYYGLPEGEYTAEVRMVESPSTVGLSDYLQIDAVAIFGDVTQGTLLTPGLYDNTAAGIDYEPGVFWTANTTTFGPTKGPYNKTEQTASNVGTIAQFFLQGNAFTLYQTAGIYSANVRVCLVITNTPIHCGTQGETLLSKQVNEFSQSKVGTTYFTPIIFYGLGTGSHQIIIENRNHAKKMGVDAVRVWN